MRILVLSPIFPDSPCDGDRLRLYHFMRELSRRHELHLACFVDPARPEDADLKALKGIAAQVHGVTMPRGRQWLNAGLRYAFETPSNVSAFVSGAMQDLVDRLLDSVKFDAVFCYRLRMAPYALRARLPRVIDYTDSLTRYFERRAAQSQGLKRLLWRREAEKIAAYEAWTAWQFNAGLMNSENDALTLRVMAPKARIITVSNGVDFSWLKPARLKRDPDLMVFVGNLAYAPNAEAVLWFTREIFPLIRRTRPNAKFKVIGGNAAAALKVQCSSPGVEFTGFVADFRPLLGRAAVSVCPVRLGAGRQNKILDAFALGVAVVSTSLTASGCEAQEGRHLLVADDGATFASQALRLMQRPALATRLASQALKFVRRHYDWTQSARLIEAAMKEKP